MPDSIDQKITQARAKLQQLEALQKKTAKAQDTRKKIIIGGTVFAAMAHDDDLNRRVLHYLNEFVTRPADRKVIEGLLPTAKKGSAAEATEASGE